ncbi:hypothetical protein NEAUS03_1969 [Nematocida ausubeli]|nr:hypothetical protein NEAUS03_1969 [Nematocida ausubeli]
MKEKKKGQSRQTQKLNTRRYTQDMNTSSSLNKMLSLLGYYFQAMALPPLGHVIMNSLIKQKSQGKKEVVIQDRAAIKHEENYSIEYKYQDVLSSRFLNGTDPTSNHGVLLQIPQVTPDVERKIRVWRKEVQSIINMTGLDKDLNQLIMHLVPSEVESILQGHVTLDALLDAVCNFYEKKHHTPTYTLPKQEDFLFIRDYYEAVQKMILGLQGAPIPEEKFQELVKPVFRDGLTIKTFIYYTSISYKTLEESVKDLEKVETGLLEELRDKYQGKEHLYKAMKQYTMNQPTCHKRKPYCSLHKRYGGHSTEECSLRQKHHQEKLSN